MGNSLRCCLACVLPCGALDLIRIVHLNGSVEEMTGPITAGEVLEANPNHILSKPCAHGVVRRILILSPESDLKRGSIYFLIPETSLPGPAATADKKKKAASSTDRVKKQPSTVVDIKSLSLNLSTSQVSDYDYNEREISLRDLEKLGSPRSRRQRSRCRLRDWRPHLRSISED